MEGSSLTRSWFLVLLLCVALACSPEKERVAPAKLTRITLNLNPTITYAPMMIAKEEGFFASEGIDPQFVSLDSNSALGALAAGRIDVLSTGVRAGVFNMILRGQPMNVVADKGHSVPAPCVSEAFVAPMEMAKRIAAKGGDLRGQRIAVIRGGVAEYLVARLLETRKLTPADVIEITMPQGTPFSSRTELEAVRLVNEPNLSALLKAGTVKVLANSEEVAPGHQNTFIVYGKRLLRDDPDLGRRFMRAYLRGVRQYNAGKTGRNVAIISRLTKLPPDITRNSCWPAIAGDGRIDPKAVQPFLDWALAQRYLDRPIATAAWWNPAFVDEAK
jgi:NitT/TauT family transport system substrate-binding protein